MVKMIEVMFYNTEEVQYEFRNFTPDEYDELNGYEVSENFKEKDDLQYEVWDVEMKRPRLVATFLRRWQAEKFVVNNEDEKLVVLIRE